MKKSILGVVLVVCMLFAQLTAVSASPSPSGEFDVITDGADIEILDNDDYLKNVPDGSKPLSPVFEVTSDQSEVTFYVPELSDNAGKVYAYVTYADGTTEVLEGTVDYANKTVTFNFDADKLPATVVLYAELLEVEAVGEAPKTGVVSTWTMWIALAGVLAVAGLVSRKSRA